MTFQRGSCPERATHTVTYGTGEVVVVCDKCLMGKASILGAFTKVERLTSADRMFVVQYV